MWTFKNCPRCHGDLYTERDGGIWCESCLQCGYTRAYQAMPAMNHPGRLRPALLYAESLDKAVLALRR